MPSWTSFPGGQARPLEQRAGLVGVDDLEASARVQFADDAEGGAPAGGGQRAGVAVRQDPQRAVLADPLQQPVRAERAHRTVGLHVLALYRGRLRQDRVEPFVEAGHDPVHAHHEVHGGRAGLADAGDGLAYLVVRPALALALHERDRDAVGARRADRGGAAHDQPLDRVDQGVHIMDIHGRGAVREGGLVDQREAGSGPLDGAQFLGHNGTLLMFQWCSTPYMTSKNPRRTVSEPQFETPRRMSGNEC